MNPEREAWLRERATYIGGSDIGNLILAYIGEKPWKTPYQIWEEKIGKVMPEDLSGNIRVRCGVLMEEVIAKLYEEETGRTLHHVRRVLRHPKYPFIAANLDRRIVGGEERGGVECKNVDKWIALDETKWGPTGSSTIPFAYLAQIQTYLEVTKWDYFDLAALVGGNELRIYRIHPVPEIMAAIVQLGVEFWQYVETKTAPPVTTVGDVRRKFPSQRDGKTIEATSELLPLIEEYKVVDAKCKELNGMQERRDKLTALIGDFMGDAEAITVLGTAALTFKKQSTGFRLPATFQEVEPEIFSKYAVEGHTRVMRIPSIRKRA